MTVLICYFSGTGNTKKTAELYEKTLSERGFDVTLKSLPLSFDTSVNAEEFDLIGIGYPIHSFNAPTPILKFCKSLPKIKNKNHKKRVFIFKTSGEPVRMSDISSHRTIQILRRRGYDVQNEYQYVMPYNIIFRHGDFAAYKMWQTAQKLVPIDVAEIAHGKINLPKKVFMGGLLAWILRCEQCGAHIYGIFFKTNKNCTRCGLCVKRCPAGNIKKTKHGKIKFGGKCLICMRCVFNCPKDGITPGFLNGWKVNGVYSFEQPQAPDENDRKHEKYCKKAYDRYYAAAEEKIARCNKDTTDIITDVCDIP